MREYFCQKRDETGNPCGLECTYIAAVLEYAVLRSDELKRKPAAVKRDLWVNCPVHGRVLYEHMGHHVTAGWKKKPNRSNTLKK